MEKNYYNFSMKNDELKLHGIADMIVVTHDAVYPVEFKLSAKNKKRGDILQLVAYAMLAKMCFKKSCPVGFLVGRGRVLHKISIDEEKCEQVTKIVQKICIMLEKGHKPESSASLAQCSSCEYINFCNDRL